ncbi:MAG TPA: hypothetical protein DCL18_06215 [Prevotella sp.]|nr:hypothetical protein [Prevotella sp.]
MSNAFISVLFYINDERVGNIMCDRQKTFLPIVAIVVRCDFPMCTTVQSVALLNKNAMKAGKIEDVSKKCCGITKMMKRRIKIILEPKLQTK